MDDSTFNPTLIAEKEKRRRWLALQTELSEKLCRKYKVESDVLSWMEALIEKVVDAYGVDGLKGKRILDLGCGSSISETTHDPIIFGSSLERDFEPWFCRGLQ